MIISESAESRHYFLAHRVAYFLEHGVDPTGSIVRHACDNPPCVNPAHLLDGTQQENVADAVERGRIRHGQRHTSAVLTREQVLGARERYRQGDASLQDLADQIEVDRRTLAEAVRGITWSHLPGAVSADEQDFRRKAGGTCAV